MDELNKPSGVLLAVDRHYKKVGEDGWIQNEYGSINSRCCILSAVNAFSGNNFILRHETLYWLSLQADKKIHEDPRDRVIYANDHDTFENMRRAVRRAYRAAKGNGQ
jgi:hypothetical protein